MNYLQQQLRKKLSNNITFRAMERELKGAISHVSMSRYEKGVIPRHGKQLAVLASYLDCRVDQLLENVDVVQGERTKTTQEILDCLAGSLEGQTILNILPLLTDDAIRQVLKRALELLPTDKPSEV